MENEKKKVNGYVITIIILSLIIAGLVGFIIYDNVIKNDEPKQNEVKEENKENDEINKEDLSTVLLEKFNTISINEDELYKSTSYNISQLTNEDLIATAANNIDSKYISYCVSPDDELGEAFSIDVFNDSLNELVKDRAITIEMIKNLKDVVTLTAAQYQIGEVGFVINSDNTINIIGSCGSLFSPVDYIDEKVIEAKEEEDYAYVYVKQAFARFNDNTDYLSVDYYKDYNKKTIVEKNLNYEELEYDDNIGVNKSINWDLYNTYKYTFKKDNGAYYFESFELEK